MDQGCRRFFPVAFLALTSSVSFAQKVDQPKDMILFPAGKNLPAVILLAGSYGLIQSREPLSRNAVGMALDYVGAPSRSPFVPLKRTADGETITVRSTYDTPMAFRIESKGPLLALASRSDAPVVSFEQPFLNGDRLPIPNGWIDSIYDVDRDCLIRFNGELIGFERDSRGLRVFGRNQVAVTRYQAWRRDHLGLFAWNPKLADKLRNQTQENKELHSGWTSAGIDSKELTEEDVLNAAGFLRDKLPHYGLDRIRLEGGYLKAEAPGTVGIESGETWPNRLLETNDKFPSGLSALAKQLRALGAIPEVAGVPYAPLRLLPLEQVVLEKPDTPLSLPEYGTLPDPKSKPAFTLAFLTPRESLAKAGWEFAGWNALTPWLYEAYRLAPASFWKDKKTEPEDAVRDAFAWLSKEETVLGGMLPEMLGAISTMRVEPEPVKDVNSARTAIGNAVRFHTFQGHAWQTEFAPIDLNLPTPIFKSTVAVASLLGHKVMLTGKVNPANNFQSVPPEKVDFLKKCLPVAPARFGGNVGELPFSGYLLHPFELEGDRSKEGRLVPDHGAQFTRIAEKAGGPVDLFPATLGLLSNKTFLVFDAVAGEFLGPVNAQTALTLPAVQEGDVQSVCFVPVLSRPQVIGSNRHLMQRGHAIQNERWEAGALEFEALTAPDRAITILIAVPETMKPIAAPGLVFDPATRMAKMTIPATTGKNSSIVLAKIVFEAGS